MASKWQYFEVVYRAPEGGVCVTGIEAPNRRHAVGMAMRALPAGHTLVSTTTESAFTDAQRGYHDREV